MNRRMQLPRMPFRLQLWRLPLCLFRYANPERHREYRRLRKENRELRRAFTERDRWERRFDSRQ